MTEQTEGAAAPIAESGPTEVPAEIEQATTSTEAEPAPAEEATEPAEAKEGGETEGDESSSEEEAKPRKLSRAERMKRRIAAMATELDTLRAHLIERERAAQAPEKDSAPKEADFNGDYFAYQAAKAAHDARQAVRAEFTEREQRENARKLAEQQREASDEFFERAEEIKPRVPDFDQTLEKFWQSGGRFAPHVQQELRDSDKGPELTYYLAKNPGVAAELNNLSHVEAAREVARLEAKVALPQPKKQTQAPAPKRPPAGGAAPSPSLSDLAKAGNMEEYARLRDAQDRKGRR